MSVEYERVVTVADLQAVAVRENGEKLVDVSRFRVAARPVNQDMLPYTGEIILVRESVKRRLGLAACQLSPGTSLQVVYGYRAPELQVQYFTDALARQNTSLDEWSKIEAAHREIAYPLVAGHPTGGAVDVQMIDKLGKPLDFGSPIWSFVPESATFSSGMTKLQMTNRLILREAMMAAGFAPFDGEWWHFSFGDREWAFFYEQPEAVYEQLPPRKQI